MVYCAQYPEVKARQKHTRGIVLPVVLVMLVLMTVIVLFFARRGAIDERLASNVRQVVSLDAAAQYALRRCEWWLWLAPPEIATTNGMPNPHVANMVPGDTWQTVNWNIAANELDATVVDWVPTAGVGQARCLFEDARADLEMSPFTSGQEGTLPLPNTWRKYRITAEVQTGGFNALTGRAQAEVRMKLN